MSKQTNQARPLDGIRVIEIGQLLAGPFAGTILGYYGAEVIKIEPPKTGDPIRNWREIKNGTSLWWRSLGRNKKCITLDLKSERGRELLRQLIVDADVLIENFRPGVMEKWGLAPDDVNPLNPKLIYTRISGYGQSGPYATKPGFASVCEGFGGFRYVNGHPGEPPIRPNLSIGDTLAAIHAALGVVLALVGRQRSQSGSGQVVDVAIFESIFNLMEGVIPEYDGANVVREPSGSTITGIVPSNTYPCGDGSHIIIGANTEPMFKRLSEAIGKPDWASDPRYADNAKRVARQEEIDGAIAAWTRSMPKEEALEKLDAAGIAAGPIYSVADMFADPQYQARELFETVTVDGEELIIPAIVPKLCSTPGRTDWPGPALGSYNEEIFGEYLGLSAQEREALQADGII